MNSYFSPYDRETCEKTQEDITLLKKYHILGALLSILHQCYISNAHFLCCTSFFYETDIVHPLGLPRDDLES
jgi:hypothetical protein